MTQNDQSPQIVGELPKTVTIADRLRRMVDFIGRWGSWLIVPVVVVTSIDVIARKLRYIDDQGRIHSLQLWMRENIGRVLDSTVLQELEWHFHAALFCLVLGYGVIHNTHVRIDLIRDSLAFRKKAWLELFGLTCFMIPYCLLVVFFTVDYVHSSFVIGEGSVSTVGLGNRWMIKSVLVIGLLVAAIAGFAAWLQVVTILWGPRGLRFPLLTLDWPETEQKIEGKTRVKLEDEYGLQLSDAPVPATAPPATANAPPR